MLIFTCVHKVTVSVCIWYCRLLLCLHMFTWLCLIPMKFQHVMKLLLLCYYLTIVNKHYKTRFVPTIIIVSIILNFHDEHDIGALNNKNIVFVYIHFIHICFVIFSITTPLQWLKIRRRTDVWLLKPYTEINLVVMTGDIGSSTWTFSAFCLESFDNSLWKLLNDDEKSLKR